MGRGLVASLACLLLATVACTTSGPTPIPSQQPTPTPTLTLTAAPSPTAAATAGPTPTPAATTTPFGQRGADWGPRLDVAAGPAAREDHTWTVDPQGRVAYLFGGRTADGPQADLWAFDLVSDIWTELHPTGPSPAPRFGHTATWVPDVGLVVWSGQGRDFYANMWAYDPAVDAWHELPSLGAVPPARYGSCASLGPDGRLWISHGFTQDSGRFSDTRAYDFSTGTWTDMTPAGDVPIKRCLHDCFWANGRMVLYGGQTTGVPALGDVWAYDPAQRSWLAGPQLDLEHAPRQLYALAVTDNVALIFGGGSLEGGYLGDTWALDPVTLSASAGFVSRMAPWSRSGATMVTDPASDRALLFGGMDADGLLGDLWELTDLGSLPI